MASQILHQGSFTHKSLCFVCTWSGTWWFAARFNKNESRIVYTKYKYHYFVLIFKTNKWPRKDNAACCVTCLKQFFIFWNSPNMKAILLNLGTIQNILLAGWRLFYCHLSCRVMSCHVLSCHVVVWHVVAWHVVSCHVMLCHAVLCRVMSCHFVIRYHSKHITGRVEAFLLPPVMSCCVVSCRVMSCHVMSCCGVACRGMAWHGMLCRVM